MNKVSMNEPVAQDQGTKTAQKVSIRARLAKLKQSPWVLMTVPLLFIAMAGGVWLGNNMQVITDNINQPYALLFWPMFFACIVALYLLFVFFKAIVAGLKALGKAILAWLRRPGAAFWIGTGIFMIVSIAEGSGVFNEIFKDNFNGMLGFAAAISIDAISVTCILARQDASRRNNTFGKHFFMAGIIACALISTMANGYITKEHYSAPTNIVGTIWVYCAYAIGLIPPIYIVFLGFASDYITDQKSSIFLDPIAYEKSQKERLQLLQVQLDAERETKRIKDELALLRGKKVKEAKEKKQRGPLISLNIGGKVKAEEYAKLTDQIIQQVVNQVTSQVKPEPVDVTGLQSSILANLQASMTDLVTNMDRINADDLVTKMTPVVTNLVSQSVTQSVSTLPSQQVDYDQLAKRLVPHFTGQFKTLRATIIEEVKSFVPQHVIEENHPVAGQIEAAKSTKKEPKKVTRPTQKLTDEDRLEAAVQEMISQGKRPSGRGISVIANVGKYKATEWLKVAHPEYVDGRSSDQQSDQLSDQETDESVSATTLSDDQQVAAEVTDVVTDEVTDVVTDTLEISHPQSTTGPLQSDQVDDRLEPKSDEFPAIVLTPEMVKVS
jgi:hypothetical protein